MRYRHFIAFALAAAPLAVVACSDTKDEPDASTDASTDAPVIDATPADTGADSGGLPTVACGTATCQSLQLGPTVVTACCSAATKCGLRIPPVPSAQCVERNQPGKLTTACPSAQISTATYQGCCRPDNTCGLNDTGPSALGCFTRDQFGLPNPDGGAPACDYNAVGDGGADADAGDADADAN